MSRSALTAARVLWPAFRRLVVRLGRWFAQRLKRRGAPWLARRMLRRSTGFQYKRLQAALRRGDKSAATFRRGQIRRWRHAAEWLLRNAKGLGRLVRDGLNRLAIAKRIPERLPAEGWIK